MLGKGWLDVYVKVPRSVDSFKSNPQRNISSPVIPDTSWQCPRCSLKGGVSLKKSTRGEAVILFLENGYFEKFLVVNWNRQFIQFTSKGDRRATMRVRVDQIGRAW